MPAPKRSKAPKAAKPDGKKSSSANRPPAIGVVTRRWEGGIPRSRVLHPLDFTAAPSTPPRKAIKRPVTPHPKSGRFLSRAPPSSPPPVADPVDPSGPHSSPFVPLPPSPRPRPRLPSPPPARPRRVLRKVRARTSAVMGTDNAPPPDLDMSGWRWVRQLLAERGNEQLRVLAYNYGKLRSEARTDFKTRGEAIDYCLARAHRLPRHILRRAFQLSKTERPLPRPNVCPPVYPRPAPMAEL